MDLRACGEGKRKPPASRGFQVVRDTGIEPVTSSVSGKRATAAPIAPIQAVQLSARWRRDSNPCKRLCRPVPSRSATPPCVVRPTCRDHTPRNDDDLHTRADDETRTRDPNLGKVVRYQLRYIRISLPGLAPSTRKTLPDSRARAKPRSTRACPRSWSVARVRIG